MVGSWDTIYRDSGSIIYLQIAAIVQWSMQVLVPHIGSLIADCVFHTDLLLEQWDFDTHPEEWYGWTGCHSVQKAKDFIGQDDAQEDEGNFFSSLT